MIVAIPDLWLPRVVAANSLAYGGVVAAKRSRGALVKEKDPHDPTVPDLQE